MGRKRGATSVRKEPRSGPPTPTLVEIQDPTAAAAERVEAERRRKDALNSSELRRRLGQWFDTLAPPAPTPPAPRELALQPYLRLATLVLGHLRPAMPLAAARKHIASAREAADSAPGITAEKFNTLLRPFLGQWAEFSSVDDLLECADLITDVVIDCFDEYGQFFAANEWFFKEGGCSPAGCAGLAEWLAQRRGAAAGSDDGSDGGAPRPARAPAARGAGLLPPPRRRGRAQTTMTRHDRTPPARDITPSPAPSRPPSAGAPDQATRTSSRLAAPGRRPRGLSGGAAQQPRGGRPPSGSPAEQQRPQQQPRPGERRWISGGKDSALDADRSLYLGHEAYDGSPHGASSRGSMGPWKEQLSPGAPDQQQPQHPPDAPQPAGARAPPPRRGGRRRQGGAEGAGGGDGAAGESGAEQSDGAPTPPSAEPPAPPPPLPPPAQTPRTPEEDQPPPAAAAAPPPEAHAAPAGEAAAAVADAAPAEPRAATGPVEPPAEPPPTPPTPPAAAQPPPAPPPAAAQEIDPAVEWAQRQMLRRLRTTRHSLPRRAATPQPRNELTLLSVLSGCPPGPPSPAEAATAASAAGCFAPGCRRCGAGLRAAGVAPSGACIADQWLPALPLPERQMTQVRRELADWGNAAGHCHRVVSERQRRAREGLGGATPRRRRAQRPQAADPPPPPQPAKAPPPPALKRRHRPPKRQGRPALDGAAARHLGARRGRALPLRIPVPGGAGAPRLMTLPACRPSPRRPGPQPPAASPRRQWAAPAPGPAQWGERHPQAPPPGSDAAKVAAELFVDYPCGGRLLPFVASVAALNEHRPATAPFQ